MGASHQHSIPYCLFRGGSSKGVFFHHNDLPDSEKARERMILLSMDGVGPDLRQIDGLGGGDSLTSKVAVVRISKKTGVDLDYKFYQVVLGQGVVSTAQNCGNILSAVVPFALETGIISADHPITTKRVLMENTHTLCEIMIHTPQKKITYNGDLKVDGVPGSGAPIVCNYIDVAGSTCGAIFPTGKLINLVDDIEMTCIDNGMPVVVIRANDLGITGNEDPKELEQNQKLKQKIEKIRLSIAPLMKIGGAIEKTIPKMCLISSPKKGGLINTRMFIPHKVHRAIGVLAATSVAAVGITPGTIAEDITSPTPSHSSLLVEHPSGTFPVILEVTGSGLLLKVRKSGVTRTARLISKGRVFLPSQALT